MFPTEMDNLRDITDRLRCAGHHRHADLACYLAAGALGAEDSEQRPGRADPNRPRSNHRLGKSSPFGKKTVARVDRGCAGLDRGIHQHFDIEVALQRLLADYVNISMPVP